MREETLRVTRTNSAPESSGALLGISTPLFLWIVGALVVGLLLFVALLKNFALEPSSAALIAALPTALCAGFLLVFHQGKPPGYVWDLLDSWLTKGNASPLASQRSPAPHDF